MFSNAEMRNKFTLPSRKHETLSILMWELWNQGMQHNLDLRITLA